MAVTELGREIVACALSQKTPKPFLDRGWDLHWLDDQEYRAHGAVFPDPHHAAWRYLLRHWERHGKLSEELFRYEFPQYDLPARVQEPDELIELADYELAQYAARDGFVELGRMFDAGEYQALADAAELMVRRIRDKGISGSVVDIWDREDQDVSAVINRKVKRGIGTGIAKIDDQEMFRGFHPGNLITYLGRAKAGKTSFALLSALAAAMEQYKRVMIVSVEIGAEDIHDRLDAFLAHVSLTRLQLGKLTPHEKKLVEKTYEDRGEYEAQVYIVQPTEKYTVTDLETDIDKYQPDYVLVDGFYFMTDRISGKPGAHWEGHDNLSAELKRVAMRRMITMLATHQVREKQLGGKKGGGIDDSAMMGGTGLIMASDMVIGLDADAEHNHFVTCTRSRTGYFSSVRGWWDWDTCVFNPLENEDDYAE